MRVIEILDEVSRDDAEARVPKDFETIVRRHQAKQLIDGKISDTLSHHGDLPGEGEVIVVMMPSRKTRSEKSTTPRHWFPGDWAVVPIAA